MAGNIAGRHTAASMGSARQLSMAQGRYGAMDVSEAQRLKAIKDETRRLKHFPDLSLNQEVLKAVIKKRVGLPLKVDTSLGSGWVTRVLERLIEERGQPDSVRSNNGRNFARDVRWAAPKSAGGAGCYPTTPADAERPRGEPPRATPG